MGDRGAVEMVNRAHRCICVTGMHRTGTSLVAGLLHRHGLWLGHERDMMPANPYNPDGYFENERLVEVNDAILALFDGSWSAPPDFPDQWVEDPRLSDVIERARAERRRWDDGRPWGFKDPRAALTLPFWLSIWGPITVVVTLRNPLETARSLNRRDAMPLHEAMALWRAHYLSILACTTPDTRIVVEHEDFCSDPAGSARALLSRLPGLQEADVDASTELVRQPLRHYRATISDLEAHGAPADVLELYSKLRGEVINRSASAAVGDGSDRLAEAVRTLTVELSGLDLAIRDVHVDVQRLAAVVSRLEAEIGFIRSADLLGIAAQLEYQRTNDLPGLATAVDQIGQALPPLNDRLSAIEARPTANGWRE